MLSTQVVRFSSLLFPFRLCSSSPLFGRIINDFPPLIVPTNPFQNRAGTRARIMMGRKNCPQIFIKSLTSITFQGQLMYVGSEFHCLVNILDNVVFPLCLPPSPIIWGDLRFYKLTFPSTSSKLPATVISSDHSSSNSKIIKMAVYHLPLFLHTFVTVIKSSAILSPCHSQKKQRQAWENNFPLHKASTPILYVELTFPFQDPLINEMETGKRKAENGLYL